MKVISVLLLMMLSHSIFANQCSRGNAKPLTESFLAEVIDCTRRNGSPEAFFNAGYFIGNEVTQAVQAACQAGCQGSNVNSPQCRAQFAEAYKIAARGTGGLRNYLLRAKCDFDRDKLNQIAAGGGAGAENAGGMDLSQCYYVSKSVVSPGNNSCGRTPACLATVYCPVGIFPNGSELAQATCEAPNNQCPSLNQCATGESPSWVQHSAGLEFNDGIDYRSGVLNQ